MNAPTKNQIIQQYQKDYQDLNTTMQRINELEGITNEINSAAEALGEIQKGKKDEKTMIPLGAGIYIETKLDQTKICKKSLAGNLLVDSDIKNTIKKLIEEEEKARTALNRMYEQRNRLQKSVNTLEMILKQMEKAKQ